MRILARPAIPRPRTGLRLLLGLLLLLPAAGAIHLGPTDLQAVHLVVVTYADAGPGSNESTWMSSLYGEHSAPLAVFDGVAIEEGLPLGEGGGPRLETAQTYRERYSERVTVHPGQAIHVLGRMDDHTLNATIRIVANASVLPPGSVLRAVVVEDGAAVQGRPQRFLARTEPMALNVTGPDTSLSIPLDPSWDPVRLGLVAYVQRTAANDSAPAVSQAAVWQATSGPEVRQTAKAVLVEFSTRGDCVECPYAEDALAELVQELGPQRPAHGAANRYLAIEGPLPWLVAAAGGAILTALLWPRRPGPEGVPPGPPS